MIIHIQNTMSTSKLQALEHLTLVKIEGDDATSFLQGQLTNDVTLTDNQWQFSGYCSPKGRLLTLLQLWKLQGSYYAIIDKSLSEATLKRLRMYVMRSKVTFTELQEIGFYAATEWDAISVGFPAMPRPSDNAVVSDGNTMVIRVAKQFLVMTADLIESQTNTNISEADNADSWRTNSILAGLPSVSANTIEMFIPQMLNLDIIGGINFEKGCYTGQEIIARMHYLGKLKQRMFVSHVSGQTPQAGASVYADKGCQKSVGSIVDAVSDKALAVLRLAELQNSDTFYLDANSTLRVNAHQPYELPKTKDT